jgi:dipeptidyl aminopeptidase/acylaminoacyl peptidase
LNLLEIETGMVREILACKNQLGWPAGSHSGKYLAVVTAPSSDRWIVSGTLLLIDTTSGCTRNVDTQDMDVSYTEWRSEHRLLLAGHRGLETVVGVYDVASNTFAETWRSAEIASGGRLVTVAGTTETGDCALIGEGFTRAPEIAVIRSGRYITVKSFDVGYGSMASVIAAVESISWNAPDGLEIQGLFLRPKGSAPYPTVLNIHGGPAWHWHPMQLGRPRYLPLLMLLAKGYAVLLPNPRGSSGRGEAFAACVRGDLNGADALDHLSGLDYLVKRGATDPRRIGVTGVSYGGNMTAWLITHDQRFAAAVTVAPHTNQVTEHLISNIPHFIALFLADRYDNPGGKYFQRSPIMHVRNARTPTLNICGALDRCTPPEEALQFHRALLENGVNSVLVTYPEEGHGIHKLPAAIDFAARVVGWFEQHMPASVRPAPEGLVRATPT